MRNPLERVLDVVGQYQTTLTGVGGVGSALCGIGLQDSMRTGGLPTVLWGVGIFVFVVLPTVSNRRNRLQQSRQTANECIKKALAALGAAYGHPERHVRANLMIAKSGRRKVDATTALNMSSDPDQDLEIDATAGVSGEAYLQRTPVFGDLGLALSPGGPTWGLLEAERAKVRHTLKSILSVPVFDPDKPNGPLLGTLQVDSDRAYEDMGFDRPERWMIAERFADVIALLVKAGR